MDYTPYIQVGFYKILQTLLTDLNAGTYTSPLYITFLIRKSAVPEFVKEKYPKEITIVLQNQFDNLKVDDKGFSVQLSFGGKLAYIAVPFEAVLNISDPENGFQLPFPVVEENEDFFPEVPQKKAEIIDLSERLKKK